MAYTKKTWTSGETITATALNNMESGISNAALADDVAQLPGVTSTYDNAGSHNSIFRGKSLGSSITSTQAGYISSGKFTDLYVGDYWTINSVNWRIAGFDYWYRCGSTSLTTHHAVIVPDSCLYSAPMNDSNTTEGAYVGSAMYTGDSITVSDTTYTGLTNAISAIESAFGSYVLTFDNYLANATTSGYPSAAAWYTDRTCDLMTEHMVYGGPVRGQMPYGGTSVTTTRVGKSQLPLFALSPQYINIRAYYWLQDVASSSTFANVGGNGLASASAASGAHGVRPFFLIS